MAGLTLDTGALIALERGDSFRKVIATAIGDEQDIVVPAAAVAEWWRGQQGPAAKMLTGFRVEPVSEPIAKLAGCALAEIREATLIDAMIIASASLSGTVLYTGDDGDMVRLRDRFFHGVRLMHIRNPGRFL